MDNSVIPSNSSKNSKLVVIKNGVHNFSRVDEGIVTEGINETIDFIKAILK